MKAIVAFCLILVVASALAAEEEKKTDKRGIFSFGYGGHGYGGHGYHGHGYVAAPIVTHTYAHAPVYYSGHHGGYDHHYGYLH